MNFLRERPLVFSIGIGMLVALAAAFLPGVWKLLIAFVAIIGTPVVLIILRKYDIYKICGAPAAAVMLITLAVVLCLLLTSWAFFDIHAAPFDNEFDAKISGTVVEVKRSASYSSTYVVRLDTLDDKRTNAKGLLYFDGTAGLVIGERFTAEVSFVHLEDFYSIYDVSREEMLANGYVFACESSDNPTVVGTADGLEIGLSRLRTKLMTKLALYLDRDSAALVNALLLGERNELGKLKRDFTYMGTSHLLSISGLHLALLCVIVIRILRRLKSPFYLIYPVGILFVLCYMALTGFPISVIRSGIMLILSFVAAMSGRHSDGIISLFIAGGLIMLVDPAAVFDKAFGLSFTATLGVLLMLEEIDKLKNGRFADFCAKHKLISDILADALVTLGATMFILPLQWLYFGEASLASVPATLIMMPICELYLIMLFPYLLCTVLNLHYICEIFGKLIILATRIIEYISGEFAEISPLVSLNYPFVPLIIIITAIVLVLMMIKNCKSWLYAFIPFGASVAVFFACVFVWNIRNGDETTLSYINYKNEDVILLVSDGDSMLIDITSGSKSVMSLARSALAQNNQTDIDMLLLTHLHSKHGISLKALLRERIVKTLIIPEPTSQNERYSLVDILNAIEEYDINIMYYSVEEETTVKLNGVAIELPEYTKIKRSTHPMTAMNFVTESGRFSYGGGSIWESEYMWDFVADSTRLLLGKHGAVYKTPPEEIADGVIAMVVADHSLADDALAGKIDGIYSLNEDAFPLFKLEP